MSADKNIEIMNTFVGAVFAGENDKLPQYLHPDFELLHSTTVPYTGTYKGAQGFLTFLEKFMGSYDNLEMEQGDTYASPNGTLVVEINLKGNRKSDGKRVETSMLEKWEFEDGKIRRVKPHYFDPNPKR
jgi:ketosteroid isomerase-like protein